MRRQKRERAQARRERAAELAQRPSQYVQEVAQKQQEDADEESRLEKWATVYQSRTTEDARQLGKAIARIQFQQVLENEAGDGGGDPDHDDDFQRVQLRRRRHQQPKVVAPRDIDNNESHQLSTWYHSKSLARQGVAPAPSSSSSSSSSSTRDYSRYLGRYDDDDDEGSGGEATTTTHGDAEEKDAEANAEISTD